MPLAERSTVTLDHLLVLVLILHRDQPRHASHSPVAQWPDYYLQPRLTLGDLRCTCGGLSQLLLALSSSRGPDPTVPLYLRNVSLHLCTPREKSLRKLPWLHLTSLQSLGFLLASPPPVKQPASFHHGDHDKETRRCAGLRNTGHHHRALCCFWRCPLRVHTRMDPT